MLENSHKKILVKKIEIPPSDGTFYTVHRSSVDEFWWINQPRHSIVLNNPTAHHVCSNG